MLRIISTCISRCNRCGRIGSNRIALCQQGLDGICVNIHIHLGLLLNVIKCELVIRILRHIDRVTVYLQISRRVEFYILLHGAYRLRNRQHNRLALDFMIRSLHGIIITSSVWKIKRIFPVF